MMKRFLALSAMALQWTVAIAHGSDNPNSVTQRGRLPNNEVAITIREEDNKSDPSLPDASSATELAKSDTGKPGGCTTWKYLKYFFGITFAVGAALTIVLCFQFNIESYTWLQNCISHIYDKRQQKLKLSTFSESFPILHRWDLNRPSHPQRRHHYHPPHLLPNQRNHPLQTDVSISKSETPFENRRLERNRTRNFRGRVLHSGPYTFEGEKYLCYIT